MKKSDKLFIELLKRVRNSLNRRRGTKMCKELHGGCFDCKTRILIAYINEWIDLLEY